MRTVLATVLGAVLLLGILGFFGYELHKLTADQVRDHADLVTAQAANQTQVAALAALQAARVADAARTEALAHQLQLISDDRATKRNTFAKVVANATPAEKELLSSHLPAGTLQLFPRSAATADPNSSNKPVHP